MAIGPGRCGRLQGLAVCGLAAGIALAPAAPLTDTLPEGLPALAGWEKIAGEAELDGPRLSVRYELYVNPSRSGLYEVVRYRVVGEADRHPASEKLQWHVSGKELRRYECRLQDSSTACCWREMDRASDEYRRETATILWLYALHRRLLEERDSGRLPPR